MTIISVEILPSRIAELLEHRLKGENCIIRSVIISILVEKLVG